MSGPKIQFPNSTTMPKELVPFLSSLQMAVYSSTRNGSTASRPTSSDPGRYVGMPYMDMTLGIPVFLKYASSSVWVNAAGAVV